MINKIITKGFGPSRTQAGEASPVTMGFGGIPSYIVETLTGIQQVPLRYGGSSSRRRTDEELTLAIAWAKLISVNGNKPPNVQGSVSVSHSQNYASVAAELMKVRVKKATESVKVFVSRVYRR